MMGDGGHQKEHAVLPDDNFVRCQQFGRLID